MAKRGGARPGAGMPRGTKTKKTLERIEAEDAFKKRIIKSVDKLINAQLVLALGSITVMKKIEWKEGKERKSKLKVVSNITEIIDVLEKTEGCGGIIEDKFYVVMDNQPDGKAIDSLLDRTFGRAAQSLDLTSKGNEINTMSYEQARETIREREGRRGAKGNGTE